MASVTRQTSPRAWRSRRIEHSPATRRRATSRYLFIDYRLNGIASDTRQNSKLSGRSVRVSKNEKQPGAGRRRGVDRHGRSRELGGDRAIPRRDFLQGALVASATTLAGPLLKAYGAEGAVAGG